MFMSNIVVTGGGAGMGVVLRSLKNEGHNLSALVPMIASGGSTGRLRDDLGIHPVGTIRQALIALANVDDITEQAINYRFDNGELQGHNAGNFYLAVFEKVTGSILKAIEIATDKWNVQGNVLPLTNDAVDICITLDNGELICGERNINQINFDTESRITNYFLEPSLKLSDAAGQEIEQADYIIFGPGDFYFLLSSFLVDGFVDSIKKSKAKKIFICNISNRYGITTDFTLKGYIDRIEKYLGMHVLDYIIYNDRKPTEEAIAEHKKFSESFVEYNPENLSDYKDKIISQDLLLEDCLQHNDSEHVFHSCLRHDEGKLQTLLKDIISK